MALQAFSLRRAQQTTGADPKLSEITPKNWRRYPPRIAPSNRVYIPTVGYTGGTKNTAPYTPSEHGTASATNAITPATQADKLTAGNLTPGTNFATVVNEPWGTIGPREPYPVAGTPAQPLQTVTSLVPNTGTIAIGGYQLRVLGTNFTNQSQIKFDGDFHQTVWVSATELRTVVDLKKYTAGAKNVVVLDHNIDSAPSTFTVS